MVKRKRLANGQQSSNSLWDSILDDLIQEVAVEIHRESSLGVSLTNHQPFECYCVENNDEQAKPTTDLFGNDLGKSHNETISCVHCGRYVAATRYAPHLEKVRIPFHLNETSISF